jgi:hypothetical protein
MLTMAMMSLEKPKKYLTILIKMFFLLQRGREGGGVGYTFLILAKTSVFELYPAG